VATCVLKASAGAGAKANPYCPFQHYAVRCLSVTVVMLTPDQVRRRRMARLDRIQEQPRLSRHRTAHSLDSESQVGRLHPAGAKSPLAGSDHLVALLSNDLSKLENVALTTRMTRAKNCAADRICAAGPTTGGISAQP
jgi:hypothetical protein